MPIFPRLDERLREELFNVVCNYPLWSGDTISHAGAVELEALGLIARDEAGSWIPRALGIHAYNRITYDKSQS